MELPALLMLLLVEEEEDEFARLWVLPLECVAALGGGDGRTV